MSGGIISVCEVCESEISCLSIAYNTVSLGSIGKFGATSCFSPYSNGTAEMAPPSSPTTTARRRTLSCVSASPRARAE